MRYYELTYLISPELPENQLKELSQKIEDFIIKESGLLGKKADPVKRKLGYPLKKKREAFLATLNFNFAPDNLEKLEKLLKNEKEILRYIILTKQPPEKIKEKIQRRPLKKKDLSEPPIRIRESPKIELKEIDKKIEEILNE